jgi:hypothetical protein
LPTDWQRHPVKVELCDMTTENDVDLLRAVAPDRFWRRSRIGSDWWYVCPDYSGALFSLCDSFAVKKEHFFTESPINPRCEERRSLFLDGGVEKLDGDYFFGRKGTWISGRRALRFILFELGWPYQLRRHKGEHTIPTQQELTAELARQHAAEFSGKVEAVGHAFGQYVRDAKYLEAAGQAIGRPLSELQQILPKPRTVREQTLEWLLRLDLSGRGGSGLAAQFRHQLWPNFEDPLLHTEYLFRIKCGEKSPLL